MTIVLEVTNGREVCSQFQRRRSTCDVSTNLQLVPQHHYCIDCSTVVCTSWLLVLNLLEIPESHGSVNAQEKKHKNPIGVIRRVNNCSNSPQDRTRSINLACEIYESRCCMLHAGCSFVQAQKADVSNRAEESTIPLAFLRCWRHFVRVVHHSSFATPTALRILWFTAVVKKIILWLCIKCTG